MRLMNLGVEVLLCVSDCQQVSEEPLSPGTESGADP